MALAHVVGCLGPPPFLPSCRTGIRAPISYFLALSRSPNGCFSTQSWLDHEQRQSLWHARMAPSTTATPLFHADIWPLLAWWPGMLWKSAAATSGLSSQYHPRFCPTARHLRKHPAVPPPHFGCSFKTMLLSTPHPIHGSQQGPTTLSFASPPPPPDSHTPPQPASGGQNPDYLYLGHSSLHTVGLPKHSRHHLDATLALHGWIGDSRF